MKAREVGMKVKVVVMMKVGEVRVLFWKERMMGELWMVILEEGMKVKEVVLHQEVVGMRAVVAVVLPLFPPDFQLMEQ